MKVLSKKEIIAKKEVAHTIGERKILQRSLECPFLVGLKFSFQTETYLYLVTDFKSGGELFWHLQKETKFSEERARFYIAELVLALEHLHKYDIVYRWVIPRFFPEYPVHPMDLCSDLKPENILLDATGHVALCDFGLSKPDLPADQLTNTFCGTTEYLAPEVLLDDHGYSKLVDFWSLGVLLFEMCCGWSPFYDEDTQQMYKNICFGKIKFPRGVIGEDGKQFVKGVCVLPSLLTGAGCWGLYRWVTDDTPLQQLLNRNPKHRLGAQRDTEELKEHPFFKSIDWALLAAKQVTPPFKPVVESDESTNNFDPEFTSADLRDTGIDIFDDDDPSDSWTAAIGLNNGNAHQFNGPLSGANASRSTTITATNGSTGSTTSSGNSTTYSNGTRISGVAGVATATAGSRPPSAPKKVPDNTPLSSSVQEHFRGFTYQGESTMEEAASEMFPHGSEEEMLDEEEIVDVDEADPDGEWEDEEPVGRYKKRNGRSHGSG
jgi:serine/threonine protein kinase SCH9